MEAEARIAGAFVDGRRLELNVDLPLAALLQETYDDVGPGTRVTPTLGGASGPPASRR